MSKKQFTDFYESWWYLNETPVFMHDKYKELEFSYFTSSLSIDVQKVNSITRKIQSWDFLNTRVEVWLECGEPYMDDDGLVRSNSHNINYDCGGKTFEEAIINLANIVYKYNKKKENEL